MGAFLNKKTSTNTEEKKKKKKQQLNCPLSFGEGKKQFKIKVSSTNNRGSW